MNEIFLDDLREKTHRGQEGQARKGFWTGGRPYGYRLKPILDPSRKDQYGEPAKIGTKLQIDPTQAEVERDIYQRFVDGQSDRQIAKELNRQNIPSPGSTWNRRTRRCSEWMGSAIRVITRAPIYAGLVRRNAFEYVTNSDTGRYSKRPRPKSEWVEYRDESLRIVSDELIGRVLMRTKARTFSDDRIRGGGKSKYLLSGLLRCGCCKSNYVMANQTSYVCGGYRGGAACKNDIFAKPAEVEAAVLNPIRQELLAPARVAKMVTEMQRLFAEHMRRRTEVAADRPRELLELDARIQRLRHRARHRKAQAARDVPTPRPPVGGDPQRSAEGGGVVPPADSRGLGR
jgi:site-specific DNA recombinase